MSFFNPSLGSLLGRYINQQLPAFNTPPNLGLFGAPGALYGLSNALYGQSQGFNGIPYASIGGALGGDPEQSHTRTTLPSTRAQPINALPPSDQNLPSPKNSDTQGVTAPTAPHTPEAPPMPGGPTAQPQPTTTKPTETPMNGLLQMLEQIFSGSAQPNTGMFWNTR